VFTPLLAIWSIWVGITVSARSRDPRTATQLSILAGLPTVAVTSLVAFDVIPRSLKVTLGLGVALLVMIRLGARFASSVFDRERLITSTKS
jgi:ABC-2 type transport system permease protein